MDKKYIKDREGNRILPITHVTAVLDNDGNDVSSLLGTKTDESAFTAHTSDSVIHVTSAQTAAWDAKQDTLSAGTGIEISGNVISATGGGGGGKAIEAGTNISVTTGETADTINCTLPISASSEGIYTTSSYPFLSSAKKTGNVVFGYYNRLDTFGRLNNSNYNAFFGSNHYISINGDNMFIAGYNNQSGYPSSNNLSNIVLFGYHNKSSNPYETAFGTYNVSQYSSNTLGDSGNTLFSVGNGTADNARHNAFEIRQNGDIYLTKDGQDVKLQDQLGGGGSSYSAGTGIDITNDVISVTGMTELSAFTAHTADTAIHSDANVKQELSSANEEHPILIKNNTTSATTTSQTYFSSGVYINPSSSTLSVDGSIFLNKGGTNHNRSFGFKKTENGTNIDIGWDYVNRDGAGAFFRSSDYGLSTQVGAFGFYARSSNRECTLIGDVFGNLTWQNNNILHAGNSSVGKTGDTLSVTINGNTETISGGMTSGDVQSMIASALTPISETIEDNEEVTAQAINNLNENEEVISQALNELNDAVSANTTALGGLSIVKLTQAEYNALATKDNSTLYVIVN